MKKRSSAMLVLLSFAATAAAAADAGSAEGTLRFSLPSQPWCLELRGNGFLIEEHETSPDNQATRAMATDWETGMILSVYLEPALQRGDATTVRKHYFSKVISGSPFEMTEITTSEADGVAYVRHFTREFLGLEVNQLHMNAYLVHDDTWIDVHVSKVNYVPEDEALFSTLLESLRIVDRPPEELSFLETLALGNASFLHDDYEGSIDYLQRAFDIENANPTLDKVLYVPLAEYLGVAYGLTGSYDASIRVLRRGLERYPDYPGFYYNLACCFAEMGDRQAALEHLTKTLEHLDITLEHLNKTLEHSDDHPLQLRWLNPLEDPSFSSLKRDPEFKRLAKAIKKARQRFLDLGSQ